MKLWSQKVESSLVFALKQNFCIKENLKQKHVCLTCTTQNGYNGINVKNQ